MFKILGLILTICLWPASCFGSFLIEKMTLEEKVGQLLMVHFQGEIENQEAKSLIQEVKVGGVIYYNWANGLHSPEQVRNLSASLQGLAANNRIPLPLLIAVDQEGGRVIRLKSGFTQFPANKVVGMTKDPQLAENAALIIGRELRGVGINMNLAPVVDVDSNPQNPVIGDRAFGDDPKWVAIFGKSALQGYKRAGIIGCLKHFPGHGDVETDSHHDLPLIQKSMEELKKVELFPFAQLAPMADVIMTAHILVPALDAENCATLSQKTLAYLKGTLGFSGVIISDSLVMGGVLKCCQTVDEATIQALNAGCDILLLGGKLLVGEQANFELNSRDVMRIHNSIIQAIKNGRISEERVNEAVEKILKLKQQIII